MANELANKKIAILVANGFEQEELTRPRRALHDAGATTFIVSPEKEKVRAWNHSDWGETFSVDVPVAEANPDDYDGLLLPGGVMNPDAMRRNPDVQRFVRAFFEARKPVAAICHAPWTLIDAGVVKGRKLTSYPSLQTDLRNAGAEWVDQEVVVDDGW
jgi:protease I